MLLYPIEALKTQIQTRQRPKHPLQLINGLLGSAAGMFPSGFLFFFAYEPIKLLLSQLDPAADPAGLALLAVRIASAALSMAVCGLMQIPSDVVKTRVQSGAAATTSHGFAQLWLEGRGPRGLYLGAGAWLALHVPRVALTYVIYEYLRAGYASRIVPRAVLAHWESAAIGGACGMTHGFLLSPLDLVRTRLMVRPRLGPGAELAAPRSGWAEAAHIVREEGPLALLLGAPHRMLWMAARGAVFFGTLVAPPPPPSY